MAHTTLDKAIEEIRAIAEKYDYAFLKIKVDIHTESGEIPQTTKEIVVDSFLETAPTN